MQLHIKATLYRDTPTGGLAADANPVVALRKTLTKWGAHWQARFNKASTVLSRKFADKAQQTTESAVMAALNEADFTVKFRPTAKSMEAYQGVIGENINLIRNLGRETLDDIQGKVWASVRAGHDMGKLSTELHEVQGMSWRRAALVARDQNNKAKAVIEATRRQEVGIKEAIWMHSGGGVTPRESHVKAGKDRVRFDLAKGWYDPDARKYIWPGTEINCRCTSKAVIPGLDDKFQ
jgi:uncharacterized protein with gpF-like domain